MPRWGRERIQTVVGGTLAVAAVLLVFWWIGTISVAALQVGVAADRLAGGRLPPAQIPDELARLSRGLQTLEARVSPFDFYLRQAAQIPAIGDEIGAARGLLGSGAAAAAGGADLAELGRPDPSVRGERQFGDLPVVARNARENPARLEAAAQSFGGAVAARRAWPAQPDWPLLRRGTDTLDAWLPVFDGLSAGLLALPEALGTRGPRTYLIVAQNNREIRPGGGFVGSYALLTIDQGAVTEFTFGDSYELDGSGGRLVLPPRPLQDYGGIPVWLFRDANWSADFPTSADRLQEFFQRDRPIPLAGVIAVDVTAFQAFLAATGPVDLPEFGETVTSENLLEKTDQHVAYAGLGSSRHKEFLGAVAEQLIARLLPPHPDQVPGLVRSAWEMLRSKHLLIALNDPVLGEAVGRAGFDGRMRPVAGHDYLQVVDANLGYNKANGRVSREVAHIVQPTNSGSIGATLQVSYTLMSNQPSARLDLYGTYRNFVRLYLPAAIRLTRVSGFRGPAEARREADKLVVEGFISVAPGQTRTIEVEYVLLDAAVREDSYSLMYQEQPGTTRSLLRLEVLAPSGEARFRWSGEPAGDWLFRPGEKESASRLPDPALKSTDGIMTGFDWLVGRRDTVDKAQGGGYTGVGLVVG